jgi:putative endonuclease
VVDRPHRRGRGNVAEAAAARYLERKGYRILERNFFWRGCEIDIVALDRDVLVFVEVRSLRHGLGFNPIATIGPRKRAQLIKAARVYLTKNDLIGKRDCRFDVMGILVREDGEHDVEHLVDAFRA